MLFTVFLVVVGSGWSEVEVVGIFELGGISPRDQIMV